MRLSNLIRNGFAVGEVRTGSSCSSVKIRMVDIPEDEDEISRNSEFKKLKDGNLKTIDVSSIP